jgi:hypothetical protein
VVGEVVTKDYLDTKLAELKLEMIRWIVGAAAVGIVVAILVALIRTAK